MPEPREPEVTLEQFRQVTALQPFTRWTGVELVKVERGFVETRLVMRADEMTQHHGFLHGGLVAFLADNAAAYAAATEVGDVVTAQFSLNFLAPGIGEVFITRAHVLKAGKRQVTVRADVHSVKAGEEKLVAAATVLILPAGKGRVDELPAKG